MVMWAKNGRRQVLRAAQDDNFKGENKDDLP